MPVDPLAALPAQLEQIDTAGDRAALSHEPCGLGNWLVLVAIGLILTAIRLPIDLATTVFPMFSNGQWAALTTPGSEHYHPLWAPLLMIETLHGVLFAALSATLVFLFFSRSHWFPRIFIVYAISNLLFIIPEYFLAGRIPRGTARASADFEWRIVHSFLASAIWVPYMLFSRRVTNTFRRPGAFGPGTRTFAFRSEE